MLGGFTPGRLVGSTGTPKVASQLMQLRLSAVWVLAVVFDAPVPTSVEGK